MNLIYHHQKNTDGALPPLSPGLAVPAAGWLRKCPQNLWGQSHGHSGQKDSKRTEGQNEGRWHWGPEAAPGPENPPLFLIIAVPDFFSFFFWCELFQRWATCCPDLSVYLIYIIMTSFYSWPTRRNLYLFVQAHFLQVSPLMFSCWGQGYRTHSLALELHKVNGPITNCCSGLRVGWRTAQVPGLGVPNSSLSTPWRQGTRRYKQF